MSQQSSQHVKHERVRQILELLQAGQARDKIADQFGYSTWKSLDIYMRRHGFSWNSQRHIYTNAESEAPLQEESSVSSADNNFRVNPADINPEEVVRLFGMGILDARDIAKRIGFSGHKEMANYMLRCGYVWSSASQNYINSNPPSPQTDLTSDATTLNSLHSGDELHKSHTATGNINIDKYEPLLEFLWQSRDKLINFIESLNDGNKIPIYHIPGQAKTKSIFLSDRLSDLMIALCEKHSMSQKQGYEAALVEYLSNNGFRDRVEQLLDVRNSM